MRTGERRGANYYFRFLFAYAGRILRPQGGLVNPVKSRFWSGFWVIVKFVIIKKLPPAWRYRLGVRTEDSQSSNPGSIPGSATITAAITYAISEHSQFLPLWPFLWPPYCTVSDNC